MESSPPLVGVAQATGHRHINSLEAHPLQGIESVTKKGNYMSSIQSSLPIMNEQSFASLCNQYQKVSKLPFPYTHHQIQMIYKLFLKIFPYNENKKPEENIVVPTDFMNIDSNINKQWLFSQNPIIRLADTRIVVLLDDSQIASTSSKVIKVFKKSIKDNNGETIRTFHLGFCLQTGELFRIKSFWKKDESEVAERIYNLFLSKKEYPKGIMHPCQIFLSIGNKLNILMPEFEMDLFHLLVNKERSFCFKQLESIIRGLLTALVSLKENDVIHTDIKPKNFVIKRDASGKFEVNLINFSLSFSNQLKVEKEIKFANNFLYFSPERILGSLKKNAFPVITHKSDIYAVGLILYELIEGRLLPYQRSFLYSNKELEEKLVDLLSGITKFDLYPNIEENNNLSLVGDKVKYLIKMMLKLNPKDRWDAQQCLDYFNKEIVPFIPSTSADDDK